MVDMALSCVILDASLCGVPQRRKRLFVVGERGGAHNRLNAWYARSCAQLCTTHDGGTISGMPCRLSIITAIHALTRVAAYLRWMSQARRYAG